MGRGTFHYLRLLQSLSSLPWDTSRDGADTAALGNLCWGFTTLAASPSRSRLLHPCQGDTQVQAPHLPADLFQFSCPSLSLPHLAEF